MNGISRRSFLAGIATLGLAGCSSERDKISGSTLKPKKGTLEIESSPQRSDIVVTMDLFTTIRLAKMVVTLLQKSKTLATKLLSAGKLMASQRRPTVRYVAPWLLE